MATEICNLSLADVEKLSDTNFNKWKSAVQDQLEVFELWEYTQTKSIPATAPEDDKKVFANKQRQPGWKNGPTPWLKDQLMRARPRIF